MVNNKLLSGLYYFYCSVSVMATGVFACINIFETTEQLRGHYTAFNQISTMTDRQLLFYCIILASVLLLTTILSIKYMRNNQRKKVVLTSAVGWIIIIVTFVIEHLTQIVV